MKCKWNHAVYILLCLVSFDQHYECMSHPCGHNSPFFTGVWSLLPFCLGWKVTIFFLGSDVHQTWIPNAMGLDGVGWSLVSSSASTGLAPGRNKSRLAPVSGQVGTELRIPSAQFRWSRSETAKPRRCRPDTPPPPPTSLLTPFRCFHLVGGGLLVAEPRVPGGQCEGRRGKCEEQRRAARQ